MRAGPGRVLERPLPPPPRRSATHGSPGTVPRPSASLPTSSSEPRRPACLGARAVDTFASMRLEPVPHLRAGFHARVDDRAGSGLVHLGEHRATARHLIGGHEHEVWEVYYQASGTSLWQERSRVLSLSPGHLWLVPPGRPHELLRPARPEQHYYYAILDPLPALGRHPALCTTWPDPAEHDIVVTSSDVEGAFRYLVAEVCAPGALADIGLELAADTLVLEVARAIAGSPRVRVRPPHPAVATARCLLDAHPERTWTLATLARECDVSPAYLGRIFTREYGVSPRRYATERRIERATALLETGQFRVTEVATELGFRSSQHFARVFRQLRGQPPGTLRRGRNALPSSAISRPAMPRPAMSRPDDCLAPDREKPS
jgi:AraC family transcriptional regulator